MGLIRKEDIHESFLKSLYNPNLLINGDFQVWQRGLGENGTNYFNCTNCSKYTADRFAVCGENDANLIAEKQKGYGIKLTFRDHTLNTSNIRTWFDRDDILKMVGKTYTYSVEYQYEYNDPWSLGLNAFSFPDNSVNFSFIKSKKIEVGPKQIILETTFRINSVSDDATKIHIQWLRSKENVDSFGYHIIRYIKLEEGIIATPFVPRLYAEELALCKRYYEVSNNDCYISGTKTHTSYKVEYKYDVEKRVSPTIECGNRNTKGQMYLFVPNNLKLVTPNSIAPDTKKVGIEFPLQDNDQLNNGNACGVTGWIKADAEIY